jgi:triacylglycerol lipase
MARTIPYSPLQVDLYTPARRGNFFEGGWPQPPATLCAEMSRLAYARLAYGPPEDNFCFDQATIRAALNSIGFAHCQFFEKASTAEGGGTHCFLTERDDPDPAKRLAVVAFRGTDAKDPTDLTDDADFILENWYGPGKAHTGFAKALEDVRDDLIQALATVQGKVFCTGHSLGAALATLLASIRAKENTVLYTFGSPRVGDGDFVDSMTGLTSYRYVDCCDVVARVPPEVLNYEHLGDPYYIDRDGNITFAPPQDLMGDDRLRAAADYLLKYAWKPGNVGVRELADHATINYVYAVKANEG